MNDSMEKYFNEHNAKPLDEDVLIRYQKYMQKHIIPQMLKYEKEQRLLIHKIRFKLKEK